MKKNPQGKWWRRLDNTGKIFPLIANENLSNVFRISVTLREEIEPQLLQQALEEVLPHFEAYQVKMKRGFFWYYFESNKRTPLIERETGYPCRYIDPKSNQLFLFRVAYYKRRIHFEVFHAVTDGMEMCIRDSKDMVYYSQDGARQVNGLKIFPLYTAQISDLLRVSASYPQVYRMLCQAYEASEEPKPWFEKWIAEACENAGRGINGA